MNIAVNATKIIFNSPSFPSDYPRPLSCKWQFSAAEGHVINFRILTFDVFPTIFCLKDVLDIQDGDSKYSAVLQSWCGTRPSGQTIQTSKHHALLSFQAVTRGDNRQGFEFDVWSEFKYVPETGEIELGPFHLTLVAVSVAALLIFTVVGAVLVRKQLCSRESEPL
ncbi:dorsal-ventral patterning protein tolloid-like [Babylonia areolata]|uniref:dorsal-ventral patterning protein tolloid-like n=1 Tax=Babylonia areolata TaxID=304850 RepID=UPI003FCF33B9